MMPLKKLVAQRKKLEAEVGAEVRQEQKVYSAKEGKKFEKQMVKEERAKIRHLKIEKKIGKYARKGYGLVQKGKKAVQAGRKAVKTGRKVHARIGRGLGVIQGIAGQFEKGLQPPKGMGFDKKKKGKGKKKSLSGFNFPI